MFVVVVFGVLARCVFISSGISVILVNCVQPSWVKKKKRSKKTKRLKKKLGVYSLANAKCRIFLAFFVFEAFLLLFLFCWKAVGFAFFSLFPL